MGSPFLSCVLVDTAFSEKASLFQKQPKSRDVDEDNIRVKLRDYSGVNLEVRRRGEDEFSALAHHVLHDLVKCRFRAGCRVQALQDNHLGTG